MQFPASGGLLFYVFECDIANGRGKALGLLLVLKLNKLAGVKDSQCPCYSLIIILLEALIKTDCHANSHVFS